MNRISIVGLNHRLQNKARWPNLAGCLFPRCLLLLSGFPGGSDGKESACNAGDLGLIPGSSLGGGHGNPLRYSYLESPMDRGAWWVIVHGVAKSWTRLSD